MQPAGSGLQVKRPSAQVETLERLGEPHPGLFAGSLPPLPPHVSVGVIFTDLGLVLFQGLDRRVHVIAHVHVMVRLSVSRHPYLSHLVGFQALLKELGER